LQYPIALAGFIVGVTFLSAGAGTLVTFFLGAFILIAALYLSRGFGAAEVTRLAWGTMPRIPKPEWQDARARHGFWGWLRSVMGNGHYWLYLLHMVAVSPIVSLVTFIVASVYLGIVGLTLSFELWWRTLPAHAMPRAGNGLFGLFGANVTGPVRDWVMLPLNLLVGLALLALLPIIARGLLWAHWGAARALLGPFRSDALQREVIALGLSRSAAVSAEGVSLRRLERDIHDGPQQRLVRLQMDLASADRQIDLDPQKARTLIAEAMEQSKEELEELRALSRGFAPPILLDRGLVAALGSLAVRSPVPTSVLDETIEGTTLPEDIERNAYFVASELLTNVAKHASATRATVRLSIRRLPAPAGDWLDVSVTDDGVGGAIKSETHGIAGLEERLHGVGGMLDVESPEGGPTVVTAHLPIPHAL
ncbi:MAG: sensor histidine kinase, partial [Microbacteriaceae bacterium]|nr:sensor histidine kinase [Microbacteriaceae bacterium]